MGIHRHREETIGTRSYVYKKNTLDTHSQTNIKKEALQAVHEKHFPLTKYSRGRKGQGHSDPDHGQRTTELEGDPRLCFSVHPLPKKETRTKARMSEQASCCRVCLEVR